MSRISARKPGSSGRTTEPSTFGTGQHGGERIEIEQGGRHGQEEKGDAAREPRQGGSGYGRARPSRTPIRRKKR